MTPANFQSLSPHIQDLGGFQARRLLPNPARAMVGPFVFFDHMGPAVFAPGRGLDVRPHPHINLATLTYLFEGVILHRDSLGSVQEIHPGAVNWMTAGRGITHSERSPLSDRARESKLHGIQTWLALPTDCEEVAPSFEHYRAADIPSWRQGQASLRLIAGQSQGYTSPVKVFSPTLYLDAELPAGSQFELAADYRDRALYSVTAGLSLNGGLLPQYQLTVLPPDLPVTVAASAASRCIVVGGEPLGERLKWWNFVSSRPERIEQAKQDWRAGRFAPVPDESEFIPLPAET